MPARRWGSSCVALRCARSTSGAAASRYSPADDLRTMSALPTCGLERAAQILRVHPSTARELAKARKIPGRKVGRAWVFVEADLLDFLRGEPCRSTNEGTCGGSTSSRR